MKSIKNNLTQISMCILLLLSTNAYCQNNNFEEVVYLKNGSIIHGIIIEQVPNQSIKIKTNDGNVFVYKVEEIEKITKEESLKENGNNTRTNVSDNSIESSSNSKTNFKPYYSFIAEGGYFIGVGEVNTDQDLVIDPFYSSYSSPLKLTNEDGGYSLRTVHAYVVSDNFSIGAGIGFDFYKSMVLMPITLDGRISFGNSITKPFINLAIGHSVAVDAIKGGFNFNIGFGVKTASAWAFNLSYRIQDSPFGFKYLGDTYLVNGTGKYIAISSSYYF